jgi:hypothetical protein
MDDAVAIRDQIGPGRASSEFRTVSLIGFDDVRVEARLRACVSGPRDCPQPCQRDDRHAVGPRLGAQGATDSYPSTSAFRDRAASNSVSCWRAFSIAHRGHRTRVRRRGPRAPSSVAAAPRRVAIVVHHEHALNVGSTLHPA